MSNKYRIDWHAGMRLTDETFRSSDEYYLSLLQPLYAFITSGNYGLMDVPAFRYEINDYNLSIIELQITGICFSGKLIQLSFNRSERDIFQNINIPKTTEPLILYIDITSDQTVRISPLNAVVPFCDANYQIQIKSESEHYNNPDAIPFARLTYNNGWEMDTSFIAPAISLRANGWLLRSATNYTVELEKVIKAFKEITYTEEYHTIISAIPVLHRISLEVRKEADSMTPKHFITLMQEGIQIIISLCEIEKIDVPQSGRCLAFIESHYTPYIIAHLVNEGIDLTRMLIGLSQFFEKKVVEATIPETTQSRTQRRIVSTDSIRKKHH